MAKQPGQVAAKWSRNLGQSTQDIAAGIDAVTEAPGARAAAKVAEMRQHLLDAIDDGSWAAAVGSVSLSEWKAAAKGKGVQRISQGAKDAEPKMARFMQELLPVAQSISDEVRAMPKLTEADSEQRVLTAIRRMREFGKGRKR